MLIHLLEIINNFNETCLDLIIKLVHALHFPDFLLEPIAESINLIPFLFTIFVIIEIIENYFSEKIENLSLSSQKFGPLIGSFLASIPQCGFSVIATMLYVKRYITVGTLVAIYLATSDEAIPILMVHPEKVPIILPMIGIKIFIGIITGYTVDLIFKPQVGKTTEKILVDESGCCHSEVHSSLTKLFIHPIKHTLYIFAFILIINCILTTGLTYFANAINSLFNANKFIQIILSATIGLIPNCGTSVIIVMLYLKNILTFGALISGLSTNAGLGLLLLFKNNTSLKNSLCILGLLFLAACISGFALLIIL